MYLCKQIYLYIRRERICRQAVLALINFCDQVYICMCLYKYVFTNIRIYQYMCVHIYNIQSIYLYVYMYVQIYLCTWRKRICGYTVLTLIICVIGCIFVCVYTNRFIHTYKYTSTHIQINNIQSIYLPIFF